MDFLNLVFIFVSTALLSWIATGFALALLRRKGIMDFPNKRSSHSKPIPRGAGLAVIPVILLISTLLLHGELQGYHWLFFATLFIGLISWLDDLNELSPIIRLASHFFAVGCVFLLIPNSNLYFHGFFPFWLDRVIAIFLWVWFINLFNFMDGIDGITAIEASSIGFGLFFLMVIGAVENTQGLLGLVIAAAALGFLYWNWHPARLFLGDVGSVPLGFLLGWLLLDTLASHLWPTAIILPLYYFADATITLLRRVIKGEKFWRAHKEHFYQQATWSKHSHSHVSLIIAGINILLIIFTFLSLSYPILAILGALICVFCELLYMRSVK
jgi:UDP-N-acetylmuramyl pentapeptide phosphotransferase/UDP-N-acetylglucosamine-1-phosphate transferase